MLCIGLIVSKGRYKALPLGIKLSWIWPVLWVSMKGSYWYRYICSFGNELTSDCNVTLRVPIKSTNYAVIYTGFFAFDTHTQIKKTVKKCLLKCWLKQWY